MDAQDSRFTEGATVLTCRQEERLPRNDVQVPGPGLAVEDHRLRRYSPVKWTRFLILGQLS